MKQLSRLLAASLAAVTLTCLGQPSSKGPNHEHKPGGGNGGHGSNHGQSDCDSEDSDHNPHGRNLPKTPSQLKVSAISPYQINLSWSDQSNNEKGFKIERSEDGKKFSQIAEVLPNTTSYRNTSLFPDTKYFYRVRAYNSSGHSGYSQVALDRTSRPACPVSVTDWGYQGSIVGSGRTNVVSVAVATAQVLVLKGNGTVSGLELSVINGTPTPTNLNGVVAIAAADDTHLALKQDGTVVGWGFNYSGASTPPTNLNGVVAIAAGSQHSLALKNDGTVAGWGLNNYGNISPPANLRGVVAVAAGRTHSLALKSDGTVVGWGGDAIGQADPPPGLTNVTAIAAGNGFSLALKQDGTVVSWGSVGGYDIKPPTGLNGVIAIAAGDTHALALKGDGTVISWSISSSAIPTPANLGYATAIAAGGNRRAALTTSPERPATPVAQVHTANRVGLAWVNYTPGVVGTQIERALVSGPYYEQGDWTHVGFANPGVTHFDDTQITTNASYYYRVRAVNDCGISGESELTFVKVAPPTVKPYLWAEAFADQVNLQWGAFGIGVTGVKLERAPDAGGVPGTWTQILATNASDIYNTRLTDTGLTANLTYWYRVRALNGLGESPFSDPVSVTILPPSAPNSLSAYIGSTNQIKLSWFGPWPQDQDGILIERSTHAGGGTGTWAQVAIVTNNSYTGYFMDNGVTANMTYSYRVRAFNVLGQSPYSAETSIAVIAPAAPKVIWSFPFANTITVEWEISDYPGGVERFKLERAVDAGGNPASWTEIATITNSDISARYFSYTDGGLAAATYWYRLRAFNWVGESPYSTPISDTIALPGTPNYLSAQIGFSNLVNLSWSSGDRADQHGFKIERASDAGGAPGSWKEIGTIGSTNSWNGRFDDANAKPNRTYWYRVRSFNMLGHSPYSEPFPFSVVPPEEPVLSATPVINRVQLSWNVPTKGAVGFRLERAPDAGGSPGGWTAIARFNPAINPYGNASGSFVDTNRAANATYWYRVLAFNWAGNSPYSYPVSATIVPPAAPVNLTVKIGTTNRVDLTWEGHGQEAGFRVERAPAVGGNPGTWSHLATISATNFYGYFSYADSTVKRSSNYWYRVRSFNIVGNSPFSSAVSISIIPPPAPTELQASTYADRVQLWWSADYYSYGRVDVVEVERALDAGGIPGSWTRIATVDSSTAMYVDTGRLANTKYWYRVRAVNWVGASSYSGNVSITVTPPAPPLGLLGAVGTTNQINLDLFASANLDQSGFRLERAADVGGSPGAWDEIASIPATNSYSASYTDTNVTAYTTNWYRTRAYNLAGISDYAAPINLAVLPPPPPAPFTASAFADLVKLNWTDYYRGEIGGFKVERAPDVAGSPGTWAEIAATIATNSHSDFWYSAYTDTGRTPDTTSWYRVRAYNWVGNSTYSDEVSVTTRLPSAPYSLSANLGSTNQIQIRWSPNYPYDQDGFLLERATDAGGIPGVWSEIATLNDSYGYYLDTNVIVYTTNWYRVRAFNGAGVSMPSDSVSVGVLPPPQPWYLLASAFKNQINLNWFEPFTSDSVGFKVERAPDVGGMPGAWTQLAIVSGLFYVSYTDENLLANTTYWYRVRPFNWVGDGAYTDPAQATILPPNAPVYLTATVGNTNQTRLWWSAGNVPPDQDGFIIEHADDAGGAPGQWTELETIAATNASWISYDATNVNAYTTNWYRVRAFNIVGVSTSSIPDSVVTLPPPAPEYFSAGTFAQQANLSWNSYYAEYGFVDGFKIERAPDVGGSPGAWAQIGVMNDFSSNAYYTDTNLTPGAAYWYRVCAYNWIGNGAYSVLQKVTIKPPSAPSIYATIGTTNQVNLILYAAAPNDQDGFRIERAGDSLGSPGAWTEIAILAATNAYAASYVDTNVTANTTSWYRVRAFNVVGVSDFSVPVKISITPPPAPTFLYVLTPAVEAVSLYWSYFYPGEVEGFKVQRATDAGGAPGVWSQIATVRYNGYYVDTAVVTNTTYWYRLQAFNWVGDSLPSTPLNVTVVPRIVISPVPPIVSNSQPPRISSLQITNNDVVITWTGTGGSTNVVEATTNLAAEFSDISPKLVIIGNGETTTSYRDTGAMTNAASRFYRIRIAP